MQMHNQRQLLKDFDALWTWADERLPKPDSELTVALKKYGGTLDTRKCVNVIAKQQNIKLSGFYIQHRQNKHTSQVKHFTKLSF